MRWRFVPAVEGAERAVYWRWEAWTQAGKLFASSGGRFDTLTECLADARKNGYLPPA